MESGAADRHGLSDSLRRFGAELTATDHRAELEPAWLLALTPFLVAGLIVLVYALDKVTGIEPDLTVLYLIPVIIATYAYGRDWGMLTALVAMISEVLAHPSPDTSVVAVDALTHFAVFAFAALSVARLTRQLETIRALDNRRDFDLSLARRIHADLLEEPVACPGLEVSRRIEFARELGGDYCVVRCVPEGLFVFVADISGKGVSAALFTALLYEELNRALEATRDPGIILYQLNAALHRMLPPEMFVTAFCAIVTEVGIASANAGHEPPLVSTPAGEIVDLPATTPPLGVLASFDPVVVRVPFARGYTLLCVTDGVTESRAFFGRTDRLRDLLRRDAQRPPDALTDDILRAVHSEANGSLRDDTTVVAIRRATGVV